MANEIKTTISVDVGDGEAKLKALGDTGSAALKQIDDAAKATTKSLDDIAKSVERRTTGAVSADQFKKANEEFKRQSEEFAKQRAAQAAAPAAGAVAPQAGAGAGIDGAAFNQLKAAFGQLEGALAGAGVSFGALNTVMIAAQGGAVALAAAIGSGLVVAFEKAGDAANDTAQRLGSFLGGTGEGRKAFAGLEDLGKTLNVSATALAKPLESLIRAAPAGTQPEELTKTLGSFVTSMQAERIPEADAMKAITEFWAGAREKGFISEDNIKKLRETAPDTAQALLQAIEKLRPGVVAAGVIPTGVALQAAGGDFGADAAARKIAAGAVPDSILTAWDHLKASAERLAAAAAGGSGFADALNKAADWANGFAEYIERVKKDRDKVVQDLIESKARPTILPPTGPFDKFQPPVPPIPPISPFAAPGVAGTGSQFEGVHGRIGAATGMGEGLPELSQAAKDAAASIAGLGKTSKSTADQVGSIEQQLSKQGAVLNKAQAGLDLQFLPAEQKSQLAHDQINIEQADIAVKQAELGAAEASKQIALAGLADRHADNAVKQAELSLEGLQIQKRRNELDEKGLKGGTEDLELAKRQKQAGKEKLDADIENASIAVETAKINKSFAFLEPAKAQLAGEQAQTAIKSAELEKSDASLKLAKDEAGQPLARDLSALRYAQASLDEFKKMNETNAEQLKTLQEILQAIGNLGGKNDKKTSRASGGYISGPGTGTSDSIPAWLSDGEFVQSARATNFYGAGFMHALNQLRVPRFSVGGLAGLMSPSMPRFNGGGMVEASAASAIPHLGTLDLRTDHGSAQVMVSSAMASQLSKLATTKRLTSTGRKPGFIG